MTPLSFRQTSSFHLSSPATCAGIAYVAAFRISRHSFQFVPGGPRAGNEFHQPVRALVDKHFHKSAGRPETPKKFQARAVFLL
jgi:hypothetical protein